MLATHGLGTQLDSRRHILLERTRRLGLIQNGMMMVAYSLTQTMIATVNIMIYFSKR